jgi:hypothetical protein
LAKGCAHRPDTLMQTGKCHTRKLLAGGAGHTFLRCRAPSEPEPTPSAADGSRLARPMPHPAARPVPDAGVDEPVARRPSRQLRSIDGCTPSSTATCVSGRPLASSSETASCLNSSVNDRRVFVAISSPRSLRSLSDVSTVPGEGQAEPASFPWGRWARRSR